MENYYLSNQYKPDFFNFQMDNRPHFRHFSANDTIMKPLFYCQDNLFQPQKQR
jgi:hypothetical protein